MALQALAQLKQLFCHDFDCVRTKGVPSLTLSSGRIIFFMAPLSAGWVMAAVFLLE